MKIFAMLSCFWLILLLACSGDNMTSSDEPIDPLDVDFVSEVPDQATFDFYSNPDANPEPYADILMLLQIERLDSNDPILYYVNTRKHLTHARFMTALGINGENPGQMRGTLGYRPQDIAPDGSAGLYLFDFTQPRADFTYDWVKNAYDLLIAGMPLLEGKVAFFPTQTTQLTVIASEQALYDAAPFPVYLFEDLGKRNRP